MMDARAPEMFTVCNLLGDGVRSVGTRPMTRPETIASVAARTGLSRWRVEEMLRPLVAGALEIDKSPCNFEGSCAVRVTVSAQP